MKLIESRPLVESRRLEAASRGDVMPSVQTVDLILHLHAARSRTRRLTDDLEPAQWLGPQLDIVNPPLWELGHIAWFMERWCLRLNADGSLESSHLANADALYDSSTVGHATRWRLPLPSVEDTHRFMTEVIDRVCDALSASSASETLRYFAALAAHHEDMHAEAFHHTRQTLGYCAPLLTHAGPARRLESAATGDAMFEGGAFMLGAYPEVGFVFDNEKWAHEAQVAPFSIARTAVNNTQYREFVDAGGYQQRRFWTEEGWLWVQRTRANAPRYWRNVDDQWRLRRYDRLVPIAADSPVANLTWFEAKAYCQFAARRLPTELEWEFAATRAPRNAQKAIFPWGNELPTDATANLESATVESVDAYAAGESADGCRQMIGNVWEWTDGAFYPYPGFACGPYKEYSEPWFGTHKVLRGGSFATPARLIRSTWRNFYSPERDDPFVGFRTCALDR